MWRVLLFTFSSLRFSLYLSLYLSVLPSLCFIFSLSLCFLSEKSLWSLQSHETHKSGGLRFNDKLKIKDFNRTLYLLPCFDFSRSFSFLWSLCLCSFLNLSLCFCESEKTDVAVVKAEKKQPPSRKHSTHRAGIKAQNKPQTCTTV